MAESKIYVGRLSYDVTSEELQDHFKKYGEITESKVISDRETGRSRGFGFVTYSSPQEAQAALAADGEELLGRKMQVNIARENPAGGGAGAGGRARGGRPSGGGGRRF